ncbi:MAG: DegT/DnrJ/EryC1/StrS family aminotransferase [Candidatus Diapherotrites archaeon]
MRKVSVGDFKIDKDMKKAVMETLDAEMISEGKKVEEFESKWADYIGTKHCVLTNTGTSALMAGLTAIRYKEKIPEGNKVITSPLTYIATANAVVTSKLEPVFVDVDKKTFGITPENIATFLEEQDSTKDISIIMPVHLMGYVCDMEKINKIGKKYGLSVVEDSCQAHGTKIGEKRAGNNSLMSFFSFHIAHNIQVGEMGCVNTNNSEIDALVRKIKSNGRRSDQLDDRFFHDLIGYNFKTVELLAAIGVVQLKKADEIFKKRSENVKYLNEELESLNNDLQLPEYSKDVSYLAYPIILKNRKKISRNKLMQDLASFGVESRPLFGSIPTQQPAYAHLKKKYSGVLPNSDYLGANGIYVGCHQFLTREDLNQIVSSLKKIFAK